MIHQDWCIMRIRCTGTYFPGGAETIELATKLLSNT